MLQESLADMELRLQVRFPERTVVLANGSQIAWREAGDVKQSFAVILLHGISSGSGSWLEVAQALSPQTRVLAWDAPGYGASAALATAAPRDGDYADALRESLAVLGVRRCILVGHSLGALMAARFATQVGDCEVSQLVFISPAGGYGAQTKAEQRAKVREGRLSSLAEKGVSGLAAAIDQRLVSVHGSAQDRAWVRWNTERMHPDGYTQAVDLLCESDLGNSVGQLNMPVHVWVGSDDIVTPPESCRAWAERLGANFATLKGAGHASPVEKPQVIAQRLLSMLP